MCVIFLIVFLPLLIFQCIAIFFKSSITTSSSMSTQRRNWNYLRKFKKIINTKEDSFLSYRIEQTFKEDRLPPHVLVELSDTELNRFKNNIIQVSGLEVGVSNGDLVYSSVTYGSSIKNQNHPLHQTTRQYHHTK